MYMYLHAEYTNMYIYVVLICMYISMFIHMYNLVAPQQVQGVEDP